jgi:hypothetical protein
LLDIPTSATLSGFTDGAGAGLPAPAAEPLLASEESAPENAPFAFSKAFRPNFPNVLSSPKVPLPLNMPPSLLTLSA